MPVTSFTYTDDPASTLVRANTCPEALSRAFERVLGGFPLTRAEAAEILREVDACTSPALPAAAHLELGSLETTEAEARPLRVDLPCATPAVEKVIAAANPRELRLLALERSPTDNDLEAGDA